MTPELLNKSWKFALFCRRSNHCRLLSNKEVFNYGHRRQKHPLNRNLKIAENFKSTPCKQLSPGSVYKISITFPAAKNIEYSHSPFVNNELTFPWWTKFIFRKNFEPIYRNGPSFTKGRIFFKHFIGEYSWQHSLSVWRLFVNCIEKKLNFREGKKGNKLHKVSGVRM